MIRCLKKALAQCGTYLRTGINLTPHDDLTPPRLLHYPETVATGRKRGRHLMEQPLATAFFYFYGDVMIFDSHGLPRDTGATDFADSSRLAGLLATFGHPAMNANLISLYVVDGNQGVRYPFQDPMGNLSSNNPKNFTRDQLLCLAAGLASLGRQDLCLRLYEAAKARNNRAQNVEADVVGSVKEFPNGADILSPSDMNHLRICAGKGGTIGGYAWLLIDIGFNALFARKSEPNQLMCKCKIAGRFFIKLWRLLNWNLDEAIREYWCAGEGAWRAEPELADFLILKFR